NLFTALVGDTARSRKGTSWGWMESLFATIAPDWLREHVRTGLVTGPGLIWHVRDAVIERQELTAPDGTTRFTEVVLESGVDDKRLLDVETEFAAVLAQITNPGARLSTILRQAWDGGPLASLTKRQAVTATNPHVSVIAHITVDELQRRLTTTDMANGFANRFLWCCVRRAQLLPDGGQPPPEVLQ